MLKIPLNNYASPEMFYNFPISQMTIKANYLSISEVEMVKA